MIFVLAVVLTFAIKLVLVTLFIDPHVLGDFRSALSTRLGVSFVDSLPAAGKQPGLRHVASTYRRSIATGLLRCST